MNNKYKISRAIKLFVHSKRISFSVLPSPEENQTNLPIVVPSPYTLELILDFHSFQFPVVRTKLYDFERKKQNTQITIGKRFPDFLLPSSAPHTIYKMYLEKRLGVLGGEDLDYRLHVSVIGSNSFYLLMRVASFIPGWLGYELV